MIQFQLLDISADDILIEGVPKFIITLYGKTYDTLHFNLLSTDKSLSESKKLNIDVWYDEHTNIWLKAAFDKTGHWEYRLKNIN